LQGKPYFLVCAAANPAGNSFVSQMLADSRDRLSCCPARQFLHQALKIKLM
jgi:hypothetical protein